VIRAGLIVNPKSRRNRFAGAMRRWRSESVLVEAPQTREALDGALGRFAAHGLDLLAIAGGDGTLREVLTRAPQHFPSGLPPLAVLPAGKTNALAMDLGAPRGWTLEAALKSAAAGTVRARRPLEISRRDGSDPPSRGFILGAGAFVRATQLAQATHRLGAFDNLAVGATLAAAAARTLFGGDDGPWRAGEPMRLSFGVEPLPEKRLFLVMVSTLQQLPLGLRPFGADAEGLKVLAVDAPPRRLSAALPLLISGRAASWLEGAGYHRSNPERLDLTLASPFVLDGETFPGGELSVGMGPPVDFVAP
jgi:hypothetical protein